MTTKQVRGKEIKRGDVVKCVGGTKTITHLTPHPGFKGMPAKVAWSGDWCITLFDDDVLTVFATKEPT